MTVTQTGQTWNTVFHVTSESVAEDLTRNLEYCQLIQMNFSQMSIIKTKRSYAELNLTPENRLYRSNTFNITTQSIPNTPSSLKPNSRIDEWEPLFRAAVTPLLLQENGESLAIGLLPAYVNMRPAETELMKEVVKLKTLDEAFELLRSLDDPIDKYAMMQS